MKICAYEECGKVITKHTFCCLEHQRLEKQRRRKFGIKVRLEDEGYIYRNQEDKYQADKDWHLEWLTRPLRTA